MVLFLTIRKKCEFALYQKLYLCKKKIFYKESYNSSNFYLKHFFCVLLFKIYNYSFKNRLSYFCLYVVE